MTNLKHKNGLTFKYVFIFIVLFITNSIAQKNVDSTLKTIELIKVDSIKVDKYYTLITKLISEKNFSLASDVSTKILVIANKANNDLFKGKHLYCDYKILSEQDKEFQALKKLNEAIKLFENKPNTHFKSVLYHSLGITFNTLHKYDEAIIACKTAIKMKEQINDYKGLGFAYNELGNCYNKLKLFPEAIESFNKAIENKIKANDNYALASSYNNIGTVYMYLQKYDKAIESIQKSVELKIKNKDFKRLGSSYNNLGELYYLQNNFKEAKKYYLLSQENDKKFNLLYRSITSSYGLIKVYIQNNEIDSVNSQLELAKEIAEKLNTYSAKSLYYEIKYKTDSAKTNYKEALAAFNLHKYFLNHANEEISNTNINEFKANFDFEKKDKEIELLNQNKKLQDAEITNQKLALDKRNSELNLLNKENELNALLLKQNEFEIDKNKSIAESQSKSIKFLEKEKKLKEEEAKQNEKILNQQKNIIYLFAIIGILLIGILAYAYKSNVQKKKVNKIILSQKLEVEMQRNLIEDKAKELTERQKEIIQSIEYSKRIQDSLLPTDSYIYRNINKYN